MSRRSRERANARPWEPERPSTNLGDLLKRFENAGPNFEVCGVQDEQHTGDASDWCGDGDEGDEGDEDGD